MWPCLSHHRQEKESWGVSSVAVVLACNSSTRGVEVGGLLWIQGQAGLHRESEARLSVWNCLDQSHPPFHSPTTPPSPHCTHTQKKRTKRNLFCVLWMPIEQFRSPRWACPYQANQCAWGGVLHSEVILPISMYFVISRRLKRGGPFPGRCP